MATINITRFNKIFWINIFIFCLMGGFLTHGHGADNPPVSDFDQLKQTHKVYNGNFKGQDFVGFSLAGCQVKGGNFSDANFGDLDLKGTDFYNGSFKGAKISNLQQLWTLYPTFNIAGRIESIQDGNQLHNLKLLSFDQVDVYKSRADRGDKIAQFILAYLYETYGTRDQEEQACDLYLRAAQQGVIEAYNNAGWLYENRRGVTYKTRRQALEFYERSRQHPKGNFNATRLEALCFVDAPIQYALSILYEQGKATDSDPGLSFFWCLKSAEQGYEKAIVQIGKYYKGGYGINRDLKKAIEWFEKASDNSQSCIYLGDIYYHGEGVPKDLVKSFHYRKKASDKDDMDAIKEVAWMYERGEGTNQDYTQALKFYKLSANSFQKVSSIYGTARMYEALGQYQEAVQWYEKVLSKTQERLQARDSHGGMDHPGALYRLGRLLEKGKGTAPDLVRAKDLYTQAGKTGHLPARIKLRLMERSNDSDLVNFDNLAGLTPEVQLQYIRESERIIQDLNQNHQITARSLLGIHITEEGNIEFNVLPSRVIHDIKQDYVAARDILKQVVQNHKDDPVQVNYDFITFDPFIKYYFTDVNVLIADTDITNEKFIQLLQQMHHASKDQPAYTVKVRDDLKSINGKFVEAGESKYLLRKKLLNQYNKWTLEESDYAIEVSGASAAERIHQRQGLAAIRFSQAGSVCLDGLERYLDDEESRLIASSSAQTPLGSRLSKVFNQYKETFLTKHKNTAQGAHEEAVEAMRLLKERMRLPLGLPGTFSALLYPTLGQGDDDLYDPAQVMDRFLNGGLIPNRPNIAPVLAYTPQLMIQLLKDAINSGQKSHLERGHLNLFIQKNAELKPFFLDAFMDFEENEYFNPNTDSNNIYKDAFFEKILLIHGYLVKK